MHRSAQNSLTVFLYKADSVSRDTLGLRYSKTLIVVGKRAATLSVRAAVYCYESLR